MTMKTYTCRDGSDTWEQQGESAEDVLCDLVDDAESTYQWDGQRRTFYVHLHVVGRDDEAWGTARIDPTEPPCRSLDEHVWEPDENIGCAENPGVVGSGGGVKIYEECSRCGNRRVTDTWGQDDSNGQEGVEVVTYLDRNDDDDEE